jgi:hypothetical protein
MKRQIGIQSKKAKDTQIYIPQYSQQYCTVTNPQDTRVSQVFTPVVLQFKDRKYFKFKQAHEIVVVEDVVVRDVPYPLKETSIHVNIKFLVIMPGKCLPCRQRQRECEDYQSGSPSIGLLQVMQPIYPHQR